MKKSLAIVQSLRDSVSIRDLCKTSELPYGVWLTRNKTISWRDFCTLLNALGYVVGVDDDVKIPLSADADEVLEMFEGFVYRTYIKSKSGKKVYFTFKNAE